MRLRRVFLQLTADIRHIDAQDLVVLALVRAPDIVQQGGIGEHAAGLARQPLDNFVFVLGEVDFLAADRDRAALKVDAEILIFVRRGDQRCAPRQAGWHAGAPRGSARAVRSSQRAW